MVQESLPDHETEFTSMKKVATNFRISLEAARGSKPWSEADPGLGRGFSSQERDEVRRLSR